MNPRVSVAARLGCSLGEALHWDNERSLLWLVDIVRHHLIWFDPEQGSVGKSFFPEPVCWVLSLGRLKSVIVGFKSGIAKVDCLHSGRQVEWVDRSFPGNPELRLNDAKVDMFGRIWAGAMDGASRPRSVGSLARYSFSDRCWTVMDRDYLIPNGPAFSPDGAIMLHTDSARRTVYRYTVNPGTGEVADRSIWREFALDNGLPDGMTFDSDGYVWIAHWGTGLVRRYDPTGELALSVSMPTPFITSVCFGGKDLDRLFVTSAASEPGANSMNAGDLFEIHGVGASGFSLWPVQGI